MDTDESLKFQIALSKRVIHETGNGEFPIEMQLAIYDQINRDLRTEKINNNNNIKLASQKQRDLMQRLKIEFSEDTTLKQASKLISDKLEG